MRQNRPTRRTQPNAARALTLVETLLALVLGSMIVTLSATVTVQAVKIQKTAKSTLEQRWERERVFDQFEEDVRSIITWLPEDAEMVALPPEADKLITMICLVPVPSGELMASRKLPARVTYIVENSPKAGSKRFVREVVDLTATAATPSRRILLDAAEAVTIEKIAEKAVTTGRRSQAAAEEIRGVRLACRWDHTDAHSDVRIVPVPERLPR